MQAAWFPDNLKYQLSLKKFQLFLNKKLYINQWQQALTNNLSLLFQINRIQALPQNSFNSKIKIWCHKHKNIHLSYFNFKIKVIIKLDQFLKIKINLVKFINSKIQDSQLKFSIISNKILIINNSKCTKIKMQAIKDIKFIIKIIFKIIINKISINLT